MVLVPTQTGRAVEKVCRVSIIHACTTSIYLLPSAAAEESKMASLRGGLGSRSPQWTRLRGAGESALSVHAFTTHQGRRFVMFRRHNVRGSRRAHSQWRPC
jgi:hypothetical protein